MDQVEEIYDVEKLANDVQEIQGTEAPEDRAQLLINLQNTVNKVIDARDEAQKALDEANEKNTKLSKKLAELFTQITSVDDANGVETGDDLDAEDLM